MNRSTGFSRGVESATYVASSNLLCRSSEAILELYDSRTSNEQLSFKVKNELDLTIIAFVVTPNCTLQADLVSSSALKENYFPHFEFVCNKNNPCFSVNKTAISLFYDHREQLHQLKSQIDSSRPLIVTGQALGGSIASLFTLWMLDSMGSGKKRPLCITFGSPLIGDKSLQQAISRSSIWNSCFLHLASHHDPLPSSFISTKKYMPFGTFLLCSDQASACFDNPESISELLAAMASMIPLNQVLQIQHYKNIVENLYRKAICRVFTPRSEDMAPSNSLEATIIMQLLPHWPAQMQQPHQCIDVNKLVENMKQREFTLQRKTVFDPSKRLNAMKENMANLEWYKKKSKTKERGMYDTYKNESDTSDQDVVGYKKDLTLYWEAMVEEAETKPQKEFAAFRTRWLFAGTNYRRMVEPLDIAEYYRGGGENYETQGRSKHYQKLEEWFKEENTPSVVSNKQNVESILTLDSCFWAHVEEAIIACRVMNRQKLSEFEDYVYGLLKNYAVSPEIFLKYSTYMRWWNQYKQVMGTSNHSKLANFMLSPHNYELYAAGLYSFP